MRQLRAMGAFDASSRLRALADIPTLVISASDDCIARPAYGRALAAAIPGARYLEIAHAGHAVPIQCAAEINQMLEELFSRGEMLSAQC
jgi:pimeloyl-ACP methyl ester carboxylesterase